jgi:hypothetical protein
MAKEEGGKETGVKEKIVAAIRRAAAELGRAPSRGELRRITGVSHYRVLAEFRTLREAVRAAGLEPNPKGEKISTEDLLADWKRVAEKLGRRPSRAEYVREGKYSAGALTVRFGSWSGIGQKIHHGDTETRRTAKRGSRESFFCNTGRKTRINQELEKANHKGHEGTLRKNNGAGKRTEEQGELVLRVFDRAPLAAVPAPVVGMRRVTEEVAQMVVNTLLGSGYWPLAIGSWPSNQQSALGVQPRNIYHGDTEARRAAEENGRELTRRTRIEEGDFTPRGIRKDRPVMGEPFDRRPMTNAPVNELGVMVLFGMVAAGLGLQVESVQGKFPDCIARRQVAPGKWQHLRIEFEYESKNFKLHGHDPKGCDMIVCWRHNWKECPAEIEVVELSRLLGMR